MRDTTPLKHSLKAMFPGIKTIYMQQPRYKELNVQIHSATKYQTNSELDAVKYRILRFIDRGHVNLIFHCPKTKEQEKEQLSNLIQKSDSKRKHEEIATNIKKKLKTTTSLPKQDVTAGEYEILKQWKKELQKQADIVLDYPFKKKDVMKLESQQYISNITKLSQIRENSRYYMFHGFEVDGAIRLYHQVHDNYNGIEFAFISPSQQETDMLLNYSNHFTLEEEVETEEDVSFVKETSLEMRNAEGFANATVLD
jgi:hypothetical protein